MNKYNRIYAAINLDAIVNNIQQMKEHIASKTKLIAVLKADGYGHGAVEIAKLLEEYDFIWGFAVATAEEAFVLRNNQIKKPILLLGYVFEEHYKQMIEEDIRPTVFTLGTAREFSEIAKELDKTVKIHIKIDTGMGRVGFQCNKENLSLIKQISDFPNIEIEAVFTHFAKADELDKTSANQQLELYNRYVNEIEAMGTPIPMKHCSNSAGIIDMKDANLDAVRAGIIIYGLYPSNEVQMDAVKLTPALELKSHVIHVKEVPEGTGISYGWTYITDKVTRVATIPVGYADGYPRSLSNKGWVLIKGQKAPIIGRVCMDQFMADVSNIDNVEVMDEVTLIGKDGNEEITIEEMGDISGRFNYEFVCDIGKRVPRVFLKNNQVISTMDYFKE